MSAESKSCPFCGSLDVHLRTPMDDKWSCYSCHMSWNEATPAPAQSEGQEDEPVTWPKLQKPATVGAGTFGVGVSARFVVESAQRHYEWAKDERDNPKTPEQRREAELSRRRLWDLLNGDPEAGAAAPAEEEHSGYVEIHIDEYDRLGSCKRLLEMIADDEMVDPILAAQQELFAHGYRDAAPKEKP
jgi:transposase-like protein